MGMWGVHILICLYLVRQCSPNLQTIAMYSRNQNLTLLALFAKIGIHLEIFGPMVEPGGQKKFQGDKNYQILISPVKPQWKIRAPQYKYF